MPPKLRAPLKREIELDGELFTVTLTPDGLKLTRKGFRKGTELSWRALWKEEGRSSESPVASVRP